MNRHTIPPSAGKPSQRGGGDLHTNTSNQLCRGFPSGSTQRHSQFSTQICLEFMFEKKIHSTSDRGSVVECTFSEALNPSSIPESLCFCWNGLCARDCFKHSEARLRVLPSPRQFVLLGSRDSPCTEPTVYNSGTLAHICGRAFFCQSPVASTWP